MYNPLDYAAAANLYTLLSMLFVYAVGGTTLALLVLLTLDCCVQPKTRLPVTRAFKRIGLPLGTALGIALGWTTFQTWSHQEISRVDYADVHLALEKFPSLAPAVQKALSDGRILYTEMPHLQEVASKAQERAEAQAFLQTRQDVSLQATACSTCLAP